MIMYVNIPEGSYNCHLLYKGSCSGTEIMTIQPQPKKEYKSLLSHFFIFRYFDHLILGK